MDDAKLQAVLEADPALKTYVDSGENTHLLHLLNGASPDPAHRIYRADITAAEVQAVIDPVEFLALDAAGLARLQSLLAMAPYDAGNDNLKSLVQQIFPSDGKTYAALKMIATRQATVAEAAGAVPPGGTVTLDDLHRVTALIPTSQRSQYLAGAFGAPTQYARFVLPLADVQQALRGQQDATIDALLALASAKDQVLDFSAQAIEDAAVKLTPAAWTTVRQLLPKETAAFIDQRRG